MFKRIILTLVIALWCSNLIAAELSVIVHPANSASLDEAEIARIFTGRSGVFADGRTAVPVNLSDKVASRAIFDEKVLGRSSSQVKAYWSKLLFTGKGTPPKEVDSDQEVIELVKNNPNIIGYIATENVTGDVKTVLKF